MSTESQQTANETNAQKSTGPKSVEGKAKSAMNALKHGLKSKQIILPNENPLEFDQLRQRW